MQTNQALLERIDSYLNSAHEAACEVERIGPFFLFFRRDSSMPELSYARPAGPLGSAGEAEIDAVKQAFKQRGRPCRWEFLYDLYPELPSLLTANGFAEPTPRPLMIVTPETFTPEAPEALEVRHVRPGETYPVHKMLSAAFGADPAEESPESDILGPMVERGACVMAVYVEGEPVGGGVHSPKGEATEVAGIGTLPTFRRRGIAGAITSALVSDAFIRGIECVFLSAEGREVQRIYERIGFRLIGTAMDTRES